MTSLPASPAPLRKPSTPQPSTPSDSGKGLVRLAALSCTPTRPHARARHICAPARPPGAEQDRRERRKRLGLPEELTEEEKEAERQKAAAKAAEEAKRKLPVKPVTGGRAQGATALKRMGLLC